MKYWWERNSDVNLGGYTQNKVEDLTGCIPLLLDNCVVNKKIDLDNEFFAALYKQAKSFEREIKKNCKDIEDWEEYSAHVLPPQRR
jgi:hypothetical protein